MSKDPPPYVPIACAIHDHYERAIMRRGVLTARWRDGVNHKNDTIRPYALETADGEEFVLFRDSKGASFRVRLDHITIY